MKYRCSKCKVVRSKEDFYINNGKAHSWCKECFRQDHRQKYTPSKGQTDNIRKCKACQRAYAPKQRTESYFCSRDCKDRNRRELDKAQRIASKSERLCIGCNGIIPKSARVDKKWCSAKCSSIVRGHTSNTQRRIRTSEEIENFKRIDIYERDGWICQLCKKKVNPELSFPNPACASLDHVIPLSRGGSHKTSNVQLAHLRCNTSRGNKVEIISPRPPLVVNQKKVFTPKEASVLVGVSKAVLLRAIETKKVPVIQNAKFGNRYLNEDVVADLILTGVPGSLKWRGEQPKIYVHKSRSLECPNCGQLFIVTRARRKYCSALCVKESRNASRRQTPTEIRCSICGKDITNRQLNKKINLCSKKCINAHRRSRNVILRTKVCAVCKKVFNFPRKPGQPPATCSAACAKKWPSIRAKAWYTSKTVKP